MGRKVEVKVSAKKSAKKKTTKKAAKKPTKSFEETLWDTANKLRGSVESSEYSRAERDRLPKAARRADAEASVNHVVLSLIFLKFVSDKFEERRAELVAEGKEDYLDMVDWSGATKTTREGCPKGERGGANQNGVAGCVLANGSMSTNTKGEGEIRQKMVENDLVDCHPDTFTSLAA